MQKKKRRINTLTIIVALAMFALMLTACGKSEFGGNPDPGGKQITVKAVNADKGDYFIGGTVAVGEYEKIVISSNLDKGSIRVELFEAPAGESADQLPELSSEPIIEADVSSVEGTSSEVPPGIYLLKATCLEKATGHVYIEVKPLVE